LSIENLKTISQMGYHVEVVNENNIKDLLKWNTIKKKNY
jgi:hypothetical protein